MTKSIETPKSDKITAEHLAKYTLVEKENLDIFFMFGGNHTCYVRALRMDGKRRRTMIAINNTLTKGLWWKGKETGDVPKYFWFVKEDFKYHLFIGRLAFVFETKRF